VQAVARAGFRMGGVLAGVLSLALCRPADAACDPVSVELGPPALTFQEGCQIELRAWAAGSPPLFYQWWRDGQPLPGATNALYAIPSFTVFEMGTYQVSVSNACSQRTSASLELILSPDAAPPRLQCALALSAHQVLLIFDHAVVAGPASAYQFEPNVAVSEVRVLPQNRSVLELTTQTALTPGQPYRLTVLHQQDTSGNLQQPDPSATEVMLSEPAQLPPAGELALKPVCGYLVLAWQGEGVLQQASSPAGPWMDLPWASSPFVWSIAPGHCQYPAPAAKRFYRLRLPP